MTPVNTEIAIAISDDSWVTTNYVQADGSVGALEAWQTDATWGTKTVTGLSANTGYKVKVKARNGDNDETGFGTENSIYTSANTPNAESATNIVATSLRLNWSSGGAQKDYAYGTTSGCLDGTTSNTYLDLTSLTAGTQYTRYVCARNGDDVKTSAVTLSEYTLPGNPSGLAASNATSSSLDLSWAKGTNGDKTMIRRKTGSYPTSESDGSQAYFDTGTSFTDSGLSANTTYYYRAWAYDSDSEYYSDSYSGAEGTTIVGMPSATAQAVSPVEETTATLNGLAADDGGEACEIRFQWGLTDNYGHDTDWQAGKTTDDTFSQAITGLGKGTFYHFRVQIKNSVGTANSGDLTFLTKPLEPISFSATVVTGVRIDLSWTKGETAVRTMVRRSIGDYVTGPTDGVQAYLDTGTSASDTGLIPGTTYYYMAWSEVTIGGLTQYSDDYGQDSKTTYGPPTAQSDSAALVEETTVTLNGTVLNDEGEDCEYQFQYGETDSYGTNTGFEGIVNTSDAFEKALTGLTQGTLYHFRAQVKNSAGTGSGDDKTFLTKPNEPSSLAAVSIDTGQIDLSWSKGTGADKTIIRRKTSSYPADYTDGTQVYFDTGTTKSDTGLAGGITYYYRAWSEITDDSLQKYSDTYSQASATTKAVPTALGSGITSAPNPVYAGKEDSLIAVYSDQDGYSDLDKMYLKIDHDSSSDIEIYAAESGATGSGSVTIVSGSGYLIGTPAYSYTSSGNNITLTFTFKLDWDWTESSLIEYAVKAIDDQDNASSYNSTDLDVQYENDLDFFGTLAVSGSVAGSLSSGDWVQGSETLSWSGLTVVYQGSSLSPAEADFDIRITDDDTGSRTQASGTELDLETTADAAADAEDIHNINIINIPAGGTDASSQTWTVRVDVSAPANVGLTSVKANSSRKITVTAQTASDSESGSVLYWFRETSGNSGASSSVDWQSSISFVDDGLSASKEYTYSVKAKDGANNQSGYSGSLSRKTYPLPVILPPAAEKPAVEEPTEGPAEEIAPEAPPEEPAEAAIINEIKARVAEILEKIAKLQIQLAQLLKEEKEEVEEEKETPETQSAKYLYIGQESQGVKYLQMFLKSRGKEIYPEGLVTGYFGSLTRAAVIRFQIKQGIISSETGYGAGFVGPETRAKINEAASLEESIEGEEEEEEEEEEELPIKKQIPFSEQNLRDPEKMAEEIFEEYLPDTVKAYGQWLQQGAKGVWQKTWPF